MFSLIELLLEESGYVAYCASDNYLVMAPKDPDILAKCYVGLVSHIDTVSKVQQVYKNIQEKDLYNTCGCCCLDDRLGVLMSLRTIKYTSKHDCVCIFLNGEESGCLGAIELAENFNEFDDIFAPLENNVQCLIEIDRHGVDEVVFYDLDYPDFEQAFYLYNKNISHAWTDIAVLGPMWNIAAANVSAGYYKEHTQGEFMTYFGFMLAENKLRNVLKHFTSFSKKARYEYRGKSTTCCQLLMWYNCPPEYDDMGLSVLE